MALKNEHGTYYIQLKKFKKCLPLPIALKNLKM
jgi:hypothetical protein